MSTLRELLTKKDFNWEDGVIVIQPIWVEGSGWVKKEVFKSTTDIRRCKELLDLDFDQENTHCYFIAKDDKFTYFLAHHDGFSWIEKIFIYIDEYLKIDTCIPYPGGD